MNFLKKATLAAAIAAAPFAAQAELKAMDDALMSATTGQAGVTIEMDAKVAIGSVIYQDENTGTGGTTAIGTVAIEGITLQETDGTAVTIKQEIDVTAGGDLSVKISDIDNLRVQVDGIKIGNSTAANALTSAAPIASAGAIRVDIGKVNGITQTISTGGAAGSGLTIGMNGVDIDNLDLTYVDGQFAGADTAARSTATTITAGSAAAQVKGVNVDIGALTQNIDVVSIDRDLDGAGGDPAKSIGALQVTMGAANINLSVGSIGFASTDQFNAVSGAAPVASIGSIAVNGLNMAGTTQRIYGH